MNGQTPAAPNVNLELTKTLRSILAAAERGQVGSLVVVGCNPEGNMIKGATVDPAHLFVILAGLSTMLFKVNQQIIALEQPGTPSAIHQAKTMPGEMR